MVITATQTYARQTPRKVRLVANAVKKLPLAEAFRQLGVMDRTASILVLKVLRQAVANATHNHGVAVNDLMIQSITVDAGPVYKRFQAVSRGRAHGIRKETSHVKVVLATKAAEVVTPEKVAPAAKKEVVAQTAEKAETKAPAAKKPAAKKTTKKEVTK